MCVLDCVQSYVVSGGGPGILLPTDFRDARLVYLSSVLVQIHDLYFIFSLVSAFSQKNKTYKIGLGVCVCVCVCVCVYVCVCVSVYNFGPPLTISKPATRLIQNFGYI